MKWFFALDSALGADRTVIPSRAEEDPLAGCRPDHVDAESGYRYYLLTQAAVAARIRLLRMLDMPLEEIRAVLHAADEDVARGHLIRYHQRLADRIARDQESLLLLQRVVERPQEFMAFNVTVKEVADSAGPQARHLCHRRELRIGDQACLPRSGELCCERRVLLPRAATDHRPSSVLGARYVSGNLPADRPDCPGKRRDREGHPSRRLRVIGHSSGRILRAGDDLSSTRDVDRAAWLHRQWPSAHRRADEPRRRDESSRVSHRGDLADPTSEESRAMRRPRARSSPTRARLHRVAAGRAGSVGASGVSLVREERDSGEGHQFHRPSNVTNAGMSSVRIKNVSIRMPAATPKPSWRV
jgi:DNA-binding transcriptional MerR regulator